MSKNGVTKLYLGLDPGASGGLVCLNGSGKIVHCTKMPDTEAGVWAWLSEYIPSDQLEVYAVLEKVTGYIGTHRRKANADGSESANVAPGSSMFNFGRNVGTLVGMLTAMTVFPYRCTEVWPRTWQAAFDIKKLPGEDYTNRKRRLKELAASYFPSEKPTLAVCDALLLALHCKRIYGN